MRRLIAIVTSILGLVFVTWTQTFVGATAVVAAPACSNYDAGLLGEITGVVVLGETLSAGHGCGVGEDEIYKYAAVVSLPLNPQLGARQGSYTAGGVADCFANLTFSDLCEPVQDGGNNEYNLVVYAYTQAQWAALDPNGAIEAQLAQNNTETFPSGSTDCTGSVPSVPVPIAPQTQLIQAAGWSTTCTATQQQSIPVLANCGPLVKGPGATFGDAATPPEDAATPSDAAPVSDAGADAALHDAANVDASDAD